METLYISHTGQTPLGDIWLAVSEHGLVAVDFPTTESAFADMLVARHKCRVEVNPGWGAQAAAQLREYTQGQRRTFDIAIDWSVLTPYQRRVLQITADIPYGQTLTYKEIAAALGNPRAARAVGRAEATNPMPIVLPCHRVIGADHKLRGYGAGAGLPTKDWLLRMEEGLL
jgi:O-6-methylguanine DNA methyltransferase